MRKYTIASKTIAVFMCMAILFSFASVCGIHAVAEGTAGSYTWRVRVKVDDNFDSTSDDSDRSYLTIKGGERPL